jgi:hypothetical protein
MMAQRTKSRLAKIGRNVTVVNQDVSLPVYSVFLLDPADVHHGDMQC